MGLPRSWSTSGIFAQACKDDQRKEKALLLFRERTSSISTLRTVAGKHYFPVTCYFLQVRLRTIYFNPNSPALFSHRKNVYPNQHPISNYGIPCTYLELE